MFPEATTVTLPGKSHRKANADVRGIAWNNAVPVPGVRIMEGRGRSVQTGDAGLKLPSFPSGLKFRVLAFAVVRSVGTRLPLRLLLLRLLLLLLRLLLLRR